MLRPPLSRAASMADATALFELQARWETVWFGAPEESEAEAREHLERIDDFDAQSRLLLDGDRLLAAAIWWEHDTLLAVDPDVDAAPLYADLLPWLATRGPREAEALSGDTVRQDALREGGWRHVQSSFELIREVEPSWHPAQPIWPDGITITDLRDGDAEAVHHMVYVDAQWSSVAGHPDRSYADWRSIFIIPAVDPREQVLAWRGDRLVGASLGRTWDDGTGWVSQLAVALDERGRGLGRALLLESVRRRIAGGASAVGLGVQAENRGALRLYLDVGLQIDREWMTWVPTAG